MQLDTEEGEAFSPPAGVVASPIEPPIPSDDRPGTQDSEHSDARAAAEVTREVEE